MFEAVRRYRVVTPFRELKLRCGIGHIVRGQARTIQYEAYDMDGEPFWQSPSEDYSPSTCVVCGLKIVGTVEEP